MSSPLDMPNDRIIEDLSQSIFRAIREHSREYYNIVINEYLHMYERIDEIDRIAVTFSLFEIISGSKIMFVFKESA